MDIKIEDSWKKVLKDEFQKAYFQSLVVYVKEQYQNYKCYPKGSHIFNAFNLCPFDKVKVVIIGQDPYHGKGQAHGLCFSVPNGVSKPPSLNNIFKELKDDIGIEIPTSGNLEHWAKQGVLMLNATLTVREGAAGSHQKQGWEQFTDAVIRKIDVEKSGVVFLLWGAFAQRKAKHVDDKKHFILKAKHPSPLSANFGGWFGTKHFSKCNGFLIQQGLSPIKW